MGEAGRWEAIGTGDGAGRNPVRAALTDLKAIAEAELPVGVYRYLPADRSFDSRWRYLTINKRGAVRIEP